MSEGRKPRTGVIVAILVFVFLGLVSFISDISAPKCIKAGCDNVKDLAIRSLPVAVHQSHQAMTHMMMVTMQFMMMTTTTGTDTIVIAITQMA